MYFWGCQKDYSIKKYGTFWFPAKFSPQVGLKFLSKLPEVKFQKNGSSRIQAAKFLHSQTFLNLLCSNYQYSNIMPIFSKNMTYGLQGKEKILDFPQKSLNFREICQI